MPTIVHAIDQRGVARREHFNCLLSGAGEAHLFPDLVEAARIATITADKIAAAYPEPARDPDIDSVRFG